MILKKCPFCGGVAEINRIGNDYSKSKGVTIKCTKCKVNHTMRAFKFNHEWLEEKISEWWNERAI